MAAIQIRCVKHAQRICGIMMSRTQRTLAILQLFTPERPALCAEDIVSLLDISRATAYRCINDLKANGLLDVASSGSYVLGPAIMQLDRLVRLHDPLLRLSIGLIKQLSRRTSGSVLLCRLHDMKALCIYEEKGTNSPKTISYERGRAMPLFYGATSKVMLANLEPAAVEAILKHESDALKQAGLPVSTEPLHALLAQWRTQRILRAEEEVDPDACGWAMAIYQGKELLGSLSVVLKRHSNVTDAQVTSALLQTGLRIEALLEKPPR